MKPAFAAIASLLVLSVGSSQPAGPRLAQIFDHDAGIGQVSALAFSADGRTLGAVGTAGYGAWDAQTGDPYRTGPSPSGALTTVATSAQGTYLVAGAIDGRITRIDLRSGAVREITRHQKAVTALAVSADGSLGASGDRDGQIVLWDPEGSRIGDLREGGHKRDILLLTFTGQRQLLSASADLRVVTWDADGRRPQRRGTMQSEVAGITLVPQSAAADAIGSQVVFGVQTVAEPRGGMFADRAGVARPGDLRRENALVLYAVDSGASGAPLRTGGAAPETVVVSPAGCFAFFASYDREQPRLHGWSLIARGDAVLQLDLPGRSRTLALEPSGRLLAAALEPGRIRAWRLSGAASTDCDAYRQTLAPAPPASAKASIVVGAETDPLIPPSPGLSLAVLKFDAGSLDPTLAELAAEMVAGRLANTPGLKVAERAQIDEVVRELEIQRSGLTTADAVRIGKGLNARKVVMGSVRGLGGKGFMLTVRLVDVETQQIEGSREVQCHNCGEQDLPSAVDALRRLLVR